jgi:exodeoxyribonuclease VII large subunit
MRLDVLQKYLLRGYQGNVQNLGAKLGLLAGKLDALSPLTVMARGYSIARLKNGNIIKSIKEISINSEIEVNVLDGVINCIVTGVESEEKHERG